MLTTKITDEEIKDMKVSSLPTRPTAPQSFGGRGYTAAEMKEAFDRLPLYIAERLNSLIDDINSVGDTSLAGSVRTGIYEGHTLSKFFDDLASGEAAGYIRVLGMSLAECLAQIRESIEEIRKISEEVGK